MSDLPLAQRMRIFLLILVVFLVVGFGFRYVLSKWQGANFKSKDSVVDVRDSEWGKTSQPITQADLGQAKQVTLAFFHYYSNRNEANLQAVQNLTTEPFYNTLVQEQAVMKEKKNDPWVLRELLCEAREDGIACLGAWKMRDLEAGQAKRVERLYEITLMKKAEKWLVEDVKDHTSVE